MGFTVNSPECHSGHGKQAGTNPGMGLKCSELLFNPLRG